MKRIAITLALIFLFLVAGSSDRTAKVAAQMQVPCVAYIPDEWGVYKGSSATYGLGFEASDGTLRFVNQVPCSGLHQAPVLALEVHRK